jgi:hypothetical protein
MASSTLSKLNLVAVTALPLLLGLACGKNDSTNNDNRDDDSSAGGQAPDEDGNGESTGGDDRLGGAGPGSGGDESTGDDGGLGGSSMGGDTSEPGPPDVGDGGFVRGVSVNDEGQFDLLFVIDSSISMADKQALLAQAVPQLVQRLTNPDCINHQTHEKRANPGACPDSYTPEARAFDDMHVGIVSSSIGGHRSSQCERDSWDETGTPYNRDDRGRLKPTMRDPAAKRPQASVSRRRTCQQNSIVSKCAALRTKNASGWTSTRQIAKSTLSRRNSSSMLGMAPPSTTPSSWALAQIKGVERYPGRHPRSQHCKDDPTDPDCGRPNSPPLDPFMIKSIEERPAAENPITSDAIVAATSNDPRANAINGHETNTLVMDPKFGSTGDGEA